MSSSPCGSDMVGHSSSSGGRQRSRRVAAGLARLVDHVGAGHGHVGGTAALISNITRDGPGARTSLQGLETMFSQILLTNNTDHF